MWTFLGWCLVFIIVYAVVHKLYTYSDIILRVCCKSCFAAIITFALWAIIYIQQHAEVIHTKVEELRTQL